MSGSLPSCLQEIFGWVRIPYYRDASTNRSNASESTRPDLEISGVILSVDVFQSERRISRAVNARQAEKPMTDGLDRLKVLINSSTPIVMMETSEEMRAVNLVRTACSELSMATFEWSIADGLVRSGSNAPAEVHKPL